MIRPARIVPVTQFRFTTIRPGISVFVARAIPFLSVTLLLSVLVLVFQAANILIECRTTKLFTFKSLKLFQFLDTRTYLLPCVCDFNRWLKALDGRTQTVDTATLLALKLVAVVF